VITNNKKTVRIQREFECPVSELFDQWRPENMTKWWSNLKRVDLPENVGGEVVFEWDDFDGQIRGKTEEFEKNKLWVFSWEYSTGGNISEVRCEFEATDSGSKLTIINDKTASFEEAADYDHGWHYCLEDLDKAINKAPRDKEIVLRRSFNAPIDMVFDAWSTPKHMSFWMNAGVHPDAVCKADLKTGGGFRLDYVDKDGSVHGHYGVYKEVDRPNRLVFSWISDHSEGETEVTVDLKDNNGKTDLTLTHRLFRTQKCASEHEEGWQSLWLEMEKILSN
jgi:uncharacterized protein YndB with AHSA1/START domain